MDADRIAALLEPFLGDAIPPSLAGQLQAYLDLLLRWNARMNLSAVRDPEQMVTRHFGESLLTARVLRDAGALASVNALPSLVDVGSGAGFPGIPIKLAIPEVQLTLIEPQNKKATFLREVIRTLALPDIEVFCGRAEAWNRTADIVTLRAVEKFESVLPVAASLAATRGMLCLLIGGSQLQPTERALGVGWRFNPLVRIPQSVGRVILVGNRVQLPA